MFKDFITYVKVRVVIVGVCTIADRYIKTYVRVMEKKKEKEKKESYQKPYFEPAQVKTSSSSRIKAERQIGFNVEW